VDREDFERRDPGGIVLALAFLAVAVWFGFHADAGLFTWITAAVVVAGLFGIVGLARQFPSGSAMTEDDRSGTRILSGDGGEATRGVTTS
jgi:hypothetical protein